jgi:hypothetical protein
VAPFLSILHLACISVFLQSGSLVYSIGRFTVLAGLQYWPVYSIGRFTVLAAGFEYSPLVLSIRR